VVPSLPPGRHRASDLAHPPAHRHGGEQHVAALCDKLVEEDKGDDIRAAETVPTVAVLTGGFSEAELRDAGAVAVYQSIEELRGALDETPLAAS
jgi:hypothetical protein